VRAENNLCPLLVWDDALESDDARSIINLKSFLRGGTWFLVAGVSKL